MKKEFVIIGLTLIFLFTVFTGCFGNDIDEEEKKFVGTWNRGTGPTGRPLIFTAAGNCDYHGEQARWELRDEKLVVNLTEFNNEIIFEYEFLDNDQLLILTDIETEIPLDYIRQ